jgi:hypothetical protein
VRCDTGCCNHSHLQGGCQVEHLHKYVLYAYNHASCAVSPPLQHSLACTRRFIPRRHRHSHLPALIPCCCNNTRKAGTLALSLLHPPTHSCHLLCCPHPQGCSSLHMHQFPLAAICSNNPVFAPLQHTPATHAPRLAVCKRHFVVPLAAACVGRAFASHLPCPSPHAKRG